MGRLDGKVALITGAGSGIGKESAILFAAEGAVVVVNDVNVAAGEAVVREIRENNHQAAFIKGDVTNPLEVKSLVENMIRQFNRVDILFNNAGISGVGPLHEVELEDWQRVMNVNVNGVFLVSKYVLPFMMSQKSGSIINMSSCLADIGLANRASYTASKGAVLSLTKSMQVDYAKYNIRVNALMPGTIYTPFVEDYLSRDPNPEAALDAIKRRQLSQELGRPIDVAFAALYLASDESRFMMGASFVIDGGVINGKLN
ncbi:glucose 1-dehydrogenase [Fredinandcohnia sp. QZ13]|uniref:SDR family NAD(P)-dependent oxidoreductase n=1 Tax=Fredinandcohnia sp. QZ13 TaxID=3073144 RepID=UPI0028532ED4|nr:glucose 1-dehydrogenase [Fredinandcohnia sp. QZ13]MDR4887502.1 glucose 1-dehydrogenase [Fredinandcohnia sp. QZ13]